MRKVLLAAAAAALIPAAAQAVNIDGAISAGEYASAITTLVNYSPTSGGNMQFPSNPGSFVENQSYTAYYTSDATNIYIGLQSAAPSGLLFANLYFDTNNATSPGSDIAFQIPSGSGNGIFVPATGVFSAASLISLGGLYSAVAGSGTTGDVIEVSIPWTVFTTNAAGLGQPLVLPGGGLQFRTSQTFNYAAVTGDTAVPDGTLRFGTQFAPAAAVPEPASWAMMLGGFGLLGASLRRRRAVAATA